MEYLVLKDGRTEGPFSEKEMVAHMESGRFTPEDLGQLADSPSYWTPLRKLFQVEVLPPPLPSSATEAAAQPRTFAQLLAEIKGRLMELFRLFPLESGITCLAIGCVLLVLSHAPLLIFGPWLLGALAGGGTLMLRNRVAAGLGLCAAAIFLPAILAAIFLRASLPH